MNIIDRVTSLRNLMKLEKVDAVLLFGTDPHLSEYPPIAWRSIEWISGFTGSYGKVVITKDKAVLWTDSRYFIQAEIQLKGTGFTMMRDRQPDTISIEEWLKRELETGSQVVIDGLTISGTEANLIKQKLGEKHITLTITKDLVSPIWLNRSLFSKTLIFDYPVRFAGQSRSEKLSIIRKKLFEYNSESIIITQLDDLAWTFNLRGDEINFSPLFIGYGYIDHQQSILFVNEGRVAARLKNSLIKESIQVMPYESLFNFLKLNMPKTVYLDPDRTNSIIYQFFIDRCEIIKGIAIPAELKSIKNKVEIAGMRAAHVRDGIAMVNFLYWFEKQAGKERMTELSVIEQLRIFRSQVKYFQGESFSTIAAFGSHGAIVHYSPTEETDAEILPDGILLIDSGGQYLDGTTDITRTINTGKVKTNEKSDFTCVLKGMINLAKAKFPENTKGYSLDIIARKELWNSRLNYGHGTGHGLGHYLSAHEGPMAIRADNLQIIKAGQILTNEPGLYRQNEYGIRIENALLCRNEQNSAFGKFLSFETLTMCPINRKLIRRELLTSDELQWLNTYHKRVLSALKPYLEPEVLNWLSIQCAPI